MASLEDLLKRVEFLVMDIDRLNRKVDILERKEAMKQVSPYPGYPAASYHTPPISPRRAKESMAHSHDQNVLSSSTSPTFIDLTS